MRQRPLDQARVAGRLERDCSAVGHRQRAGVELAGTMEQVYHCKLVHARRGGVRRFVAGGDQAIACGDRLRRRPRRRQLDAVDAFAPRTPLRQARLGRFASARKGPGVCRIFAEIGQVALDRSMRRRRQHAAQVRAQDAVVEVLVAQYRRRLHKAHRGIPDRNASKIKSERSSTAVSALSTFDV
jgi:hypothetical protein